jgi:hypothetical protein
MPQPQPHTQPQTLNNSENIFEFLYKDVKWFLNPVGVMQGIAWRDNWSEMIFTQEEGRFTFTTPSLAGGKHLTVVYYKDEGNIKFTIEDFS